MIIITVVLLKKKMSILLAFSVIPIISAFIALLITHSSNFAVIGKWIEAGVGKTYSITLMMMFSLPYFMLMADTGLFDDIVKAILRHVKISAPIICMITVIVACICELDGSVTSVYLITIPLLLPLYQRFHIDKRVLPFIVSVAILIMSNTPWNPRMLRAASLINEKGASTKLFLKFMPAQIFVIVVLLVIAVYFGLRAKNKGGDQKVSISNEELLAQFKDTELTRHNMFGWNLLLTAFLIFMLIAFQTVPQYYVFAFGLVVALAINFHDQDQQNKLLKKYASSLFPVAPAVLLSGVVIGVMQESGMLDAMVKALMAIVPAPLGPYFYLIVALFATPLMLLFTNDTWYYALVPLIGAFSVKYGVPLEVVVLTLFMNFGAMISVIAQPQLYIATDLDGISMDEYIKFTFWKLWGINILLVVFGVVAGVFLPKPLWA